MGKIIDRIKAEYPDRNWKFYAIGFETSDEERKQLFEEWKEEEPEHYQVNIGYLLGYHTDQKLIDAWLALSPDISHPIFGRKIGGVSPKNEKGEMIGKEKISRSND